jgi:hypothetical protein
MTPQVVRKQLIDRRREELLTVKEFADLTRVRPDSVYRRIRLHKQPGVVRFGREVRIDLIQAGTKKNAHA